MYDIDHREFIFTVCPLASWLLELQPPNKRTGWTPCSRPEFYYHRHQTLSSEVTILVLAMRTQQMWLLPRRGSLPPKQEFSSLWRDAKAWVPDATTHLCLGNTAGPCRRALVTRDTGTKLASRAGNTQFWRPQVKPHSQ